MVSPNLSKKEDNILTVNTNTRKLFQVVYGENNKEELGEDVPKIKVSDIISKIAFYYEKIRNSVDYKEEYLLRKNAIERIIKRQIIIEGIIKVSRSEEVATHLLSELIRAGYLPNNKIPESKIDEISKIIERYIKLRNYSLARISSFAKLKKGGTKTSKQDLNERNNLSNWIMAMAASEIEENLGEDKVKQVVVSNMYETLTNIIKLPADMPLKEDLEIQIYLGIHRNFLKLDQDMQSFILFKYYNSNWSKAKDEDIAKISQNINALQQAVKKQLDHPLRRQLSRLIKRYTVYYSVLLDVIAGDPTETYSNMKNNPKSFEQLVKKVCVKKYKFIKSKLWRAAMRSIIYIFLTKSVFAVLLEVPAIRWFGEEINPLSLAVNISFPALLLFVVVLFTKVPTDENTRKIIEGIKEISYEENARREPFVLRKLAKRGKTTNAIFGILYSITFFLSFGLVIWGLTAIAFNWISITIFLFFLAFVSFFSIRIRKGTKEFIIIEKKENIFSFLADFFYVPIVAAGKWLSEKFSRINLFVFILDFIIEAPFKVFVQIAEEWTKYVKERKDEIV